MVTIECRIGSDDIQEMLYYFDSGMADITTKNVAAIALRKIINSKYHVQVRRDGHKGAYKCFIGGQKFVPSRCLEKVLRTTGKSIDPEGFQFEITLPEKFLGPAHIGQ